MDALLLSLSVLIIVLWLFILTIMYRYNEYTKCNPKWRSMKEHNSETAKITNLLSSLSGKDKKEKKIVLKRKKGSALTRMRNFRDKKNIEIDLSSFMNVIEIDYIAETAWIEPATDMKILSDTLLPIGYLPAVIPEFKHITAGGAVSGYGIESTSNKYGLFHNICIEYEILMPATGKIIKVSNDKNSEIFHAIPGALNTVAIILMIKIKLIKATNYICVNYEKIHKNNIIEAIYKSIQKENNLFIEAIRVEKESNYYILCNGNFVDKKEIINNPHWKYLNMVNYYHPIYYSHILNNYNLQKTEYMDTVGYLFRHDRYTFWAAVEGMGFNASGIYAIIIRYFMGWLLDAQSIYSYRNRKHKHRSEEGPEMRLMANDFLITENGFHSFINLVEKYYPTGNIWLCPYNISPQITNNNNQQIFQPFNKNYNTFNNRFGINIGVWLKNNNFTKWYDCYNVNKNFEIECSKTGTKWYYAHSYLNKKEFWKLFNKKQYDKIRHDIGSHIQTPDLYQKCGKIGTKYDGINEHFKIDWKVVDIDQYYRLKNGKTGKVKKIIKFAMYFKTFLQIKMEQLFQ